MKLMKKVSPSENSFGEFEMFIKNCKDIFESQVKGIAVVQERIELIKRMLNEGKTRFDYNEEFYLRLEKVLNMMNNKKNLYLFVYGTLMKSCSKGQTYLSNAEFKGECTLGGYSLYDLGYFPGIIEDKEGRVKGELYSITEDIIPEIDIYEAEGTLYKRKMVKVYSDKNEPIDAYVYIYNKSIKLKNKIEFQLQPWFAGVADINKNYVWYACYGSNISKERFMKYINGDKTSKRMILREGCIDKTPPLNEKPYTFSHPIYFSNNSPRWNEKGVAFLDIHKNGQSYGEMYLITKEQFEDIQHQEGNSDSWYGVVKELGFEDGIKILTITQASRRKNVIPCIEYLNIIKKGIKETYLYLSDVDIDAYLMKSYLNSEQINLLRYLRQQEQGVSLQKIMNDLSMNKVSANNAIFDLKSIGLIKQDCRSTRQGISWNSLEAIYYTVTDKRLAIDRLK